MAELIHKRCLGCGYLLEGLPENRCPECGLEFDPDNPDSFMSRQYSGLPYLIAILLSIVAMVIPLIISGLMHRNPANESTGWTAVFLVTTGGGLVTAAYVLDGAIRLLCRPRTRVRRRAAAFAATILSAAVLAIFVRMLFV